MNSLLSSYAAQLYSKADAGLSMTLSGDLEFEEDYGRFSGERAL